MNVATGGFGTELTVKTDEGMKNQLGGMAYLITGVTSFNAIASKKAKFSGPVFSTVKKQNGYQVRQDWSFSVANVIIIFVPNVNFV